MPFNGKELAFNIKYKILSGFYSFYRNLRSFEQELNKLLNYEMISIILKHLEYLKWYKNNFKHPE